MAAEDEDMLAAVRAHSITQYKKGEFWLIRTDEDVSVLGGTLLPTVFSETEAENVNIKPEKCDIKQSVKGIGVTKVKKAG